MEKMQVDLSKYENKLGLKNKLGRFCWKIVCFFLFRPFSSSYFSFWRNFVLRCFGAKIAKRAIIYSSVNIWAPWNIELGEYSCIGPKVDFYNVALIKIGANTTISQKCYLCTSSHDIENQSNPLIVAPIFIEDQAWVAADAFVGMGVTIHQGAVVGARACVFKNIEAWTVVGGNPAKFIKNRVIK